MVQDSNRNTRILQIVIDHFRRGLRERWGREGGWGREKRVGGGREGAERRKVHKIWTNEFPSSNRLLCKITLFVSPDSGDSPGVWLFVSVIKRLESLLLLVLGQLCGIAEFEKGGGEFDEPLGVDGSHFPHVLFRRHHQLVIDHPLGLPACKGYKKRSSR